LARRVIGVLVLEEHVLSPVAVPLDLGLLEVLDEQPVTRDIIAVDDKAVVCGVDRPADRARVAVVRTPGPDVVDDRVVRVVERAKPYGPLGDR
jgi:hypothetical protein